MGAGGRGGGGGNASITYNHLSDDGRVRTTPAYAALGDTTASSRSLTVAYYADPYAEDKDGQGAPAAQQQRPAESEYAEARPMSVSLA